PAGKYHVGQIRCFYFVIIISQNTGYSWYRHIVYRPFQIPMVLVVIGSDGNVRIESLVPGYLIPAISYHTTQDTEHGTVGHPHPVVDGFARADGSKELILLFLVHYVDFTIERPRIFPGNAPFAVHFHISVAVLSKHFIGVAAGRSCLLAAEQIAFDVIAIIVFDGEMIIDIPVDGIGAFLTPACTDRRNGSFGPQGP